MLWPPMDFTNGLTLWRDFGMTAGGEFLPSTAFTAIHWTHRAFAVVLTALGAY